jgi:hypothetical protein
MRDSWPHFTLLDSRLHQPGGLGPRIYIPQIESGPVIPPGTRFPFCRLLWLAGLRWKYSTPPPHGIVQSSLKRLSLYNLGTNNIDEIVSNSSSIVCVGICCCDMCLLGCGNVFNLSLPTSRRFFSSSCCSIKSDIMNVLLKDVRKLTHRMWHPKVESLVYVEFPLPPFIL